MPLIAELMTKLEVNNTNFNRQMDLSEGKLLDFAKKGGAAIAGIGVAVAALAVTAFGTLMHYINKTSIEIDDLAKRAHKFGASVESFQRLEYAATLSGVSIEALNSGMSRLAKSVGDAQRGTGTAVAAFKELGISAKALQDLTIDKQYELIATAISKVTSSNRQAQLAIEIFGRSGVEQLNLLKTDLVATNKEFDNLGIALSDKAAQGVEDYRDSITRLGAILDGFWVQLTAQVAPALTSINSFISEQIIKLGGLGKASNLAANFMIDGLIVVAKGFQGFLNLLESVVIKFKEARLAALAFFQGVGTKGLESQIKAAETSLSKSYSDQAGGGATDSLVKGLESIKGSLAGADTKNKLDITVKTDQGFNLEIAESPEVKAKILDIYYKVTAAEARTAGR